MSDGYGRAYQHGYDDGHGDALAQRAGGGQGVVTGMVPNDHLGNLLDTLCVIRLDRDELADPTGANLRADAIATLDAMRRVLDTMTDAQLIETP